MKQQRHVSRNTMFYRRDPRVEEARKHPGWARFHRECGKAGLFFDDIDRRDTGKGYGAVAYRIEGRTPNLYRYVVANGAGGTPIEAVLDAFRGSIEAGFAVDPEIQNLLIAEVSAVAPPPPSPDLMELIG